MPSTKIPRGLLLLVVSASATLRDAAAGAAATALRAPLDSHGLPPPPSSSSSSSRVQAGIDKKDHADIDKKCDVSLLDGSLLHMGVRPPALSGFVLGVSASFVAAAVWRALCQHRRRRVRSASSWENWPPEFEARTEYVRVGASEDGERADGSAADDDTVTHRGRCHCGVVRFEAGGRDGTSSREDSPPAPPLRVTLSARHRASRG